MINGYSYYFGDLAYGNLTNQHFRSELRCVGTELSKYSVSIPSRLESFRTIFLIINFWIDILRTSGSHFEQFT